MPVETINPNRRSLDQLLDPVREILTPEVAQALVNLRANSSIQERIEDLAERHHEGQLNEDELSEYKELVNAANMIAVLQAKAQSVLTQSSP